MARGSFNDKSKAADRAGATDKLVKDKENRDAMRNRYNKNADKWEHLRESKLERMRAHKANVERRMRTSDNLDSRMYWSQRNDKLKRYTRNESLDPSWYTDNIYSNQSIDLEEEDEEEEEDPEKFDRLFARNNYNYDGTPHNNASFERKTGHIPHSDAEFNYPKSRSCCFGGGYNERAKPQLMPKSSSFTVAGRAAYGFRAAREPRPFDPTDYAVNNTGTTSGYRKFYCWQNAERDCDKYGEAKEIYHIDRDRDIYKKSKNDIMMQTQHSNANCIRNIWCRRENYKNNILNEINGNYQEDYEYGLDEKYRANDARKRLSFDSHFVEEYLIMHDPAPRPSDPHATDHLDYFSNAKQRNSIDQLFEEDVKLLNNPIDNEDDDRSNMLCGLSIPSKNRARTKSLLEVKPPNRFDDTESDSTELDLDDFSFDFEKYWTELDKSTASPTDPRYDVDYCNNNNVIGNGPGHSTIKTKNINVDKYNNGQCRRDINFNERTNDDDSTHFMHDYKQNILDLLPSPTHTARPRYPAHKPNDNHNYNRDYNRNSSRHHNDYQRTRLNGNPIGDLSKLSPIEDDLPSHDLYIETDPTELGPVNNNRKGIIKTRNGHGNPALSLINNIFSIYKPKKYAQENCRTRTKPEPMTKSMNVSSTVRPLGAPYNDFMTSIKRPLTITPPRYNANRTFSATIDQPHFKIIPEKTGLKISPLYRFGYGIDDSKLRLKCTARPLLFPL